MPDDGAVAVAGTVAKQPICSLQQKSKKTWQKIRSFGFQKATCGVSLLPKPQRTCQRKRSTRTRAQQKSALSQFIQFPVGICSGGRGFCVCRFFFVGKTYACTRVVSCFLKLRIPAKLAKRAVLNVFEHLIIKHTRHKNINYKLNQPREPGPHYSLLPAARRDPPAPHPPRG